MCTQPNEIGDGNIVIDGSAVIDFSETHMARVKMGGVTATNHTVTHPEVDWDTALAQISECTAWIESTGGKVARIGSYQDVLDCMTNGVEGVIYGPQDAAFLAADLSRLDRLYELGIRVLQLTYQGRNSLGDGCGVSNAGPLTSFGEQVVKRMDRLGIVIDLSHVSMETSWGAIRASRNPVLLTHAHAMKMTPHPRSKSDELLRAVAESGGVIGVSASSALGFLVPGVQPTLADFVRHVEYLLELVGSSHVGIGLDIDETNTERRHLAWHAAHPSLDASGVTFPYSERHTEGLDSAADFPKIAAALIAAGLSDDVVRGIMGENFARVFRDVWVNE